LTDKCRSALASGSHHLENFREADAQADIEDGRLECQSLDAGLSRNSRPHNAKLRPRRAELHVQHFAVLNLRAHADQHRPVVADIAHPNNLRERPRHFVHSPDAYRQLQGQSALFSPIHSRSEFRSNDSSES